MQVLDSIGYLDLFCPFKVLICDQLLEGLYLTFKKKSSSKRCSTGGNRSRKMKKKNGSKCRFAQPDVHKGKSLVLPMAELRT